MIARFARGRPAPRWRVTGVIAVAALAVAASGCASTVAGGPAGSRVIDVVAAENFWGSIAAQLGGSHVRVLSIMSDPNADPHDYESSAADARSVAEAKYLILNGAGYDDWMTRLMSASPNPVRRVFSIGDFLGLRVGANPHLWYSPDDVLKAENHIEADLKALDPADAAYFTRQRAATNAAFAPYWARLAALRKADGGQPVAATEDIVAYLAAYLHLKLISPPGFMAAVAEGNDPPAASVAEFQRLLSGRKVKVLVYNEQTVTALTTSIKELAARHGIPVIGVTETVQPPDASFEEWMEGELISLRSALNRNLER
jgi:zinc/manganese transport system substrate-binding protein